MNGNRNFAGAPSGAAIDPSMDLRAQHARSGGVPSQGPGYGAFTSPEALNVPVKGPGGAPGPTPRELDTIRAILDPDQFDRLLKAINRSGSLLCMPFSVDANGPLGASNTPSLPTQQNRYYLFILNRHATNSLLVGFDFFPSTGNALELAAGLGFYEMTGPCAINAIYLAGNGGAANGMLMAMY
jgi:hypothetical protein